MLVRVVATGVAGCPALGRSASLAAGDRIHGKTELQRFTALQQQRWLQKQRCMIQN